MHIRRDVYKRQGHMNVCLPFFTLEDVMDKLNTKYWFSTMQKESTENYSESLEAMLKRVDVPVRAVLGKSLVSVNDFINLQLGDVIRLGTVSYTHLEKTE